MRCRGAKPVVAAARCCSPPQVQVGGALLDEVDGGEALQVAEGDLGVAVQVERLPVVVEAKLGDDGAQALRLLRLTVVGVSEVKEGGTACDGDLCEQVA